MLENDLAGCCGEQVLVFGRDAQAVEGEQQVVGQDGPQASGEGSVLGQVGEGLASVLEGLWSVGSYPTCTGCSRLTWTTTFAVFSWWHWPTPTWLPVRHERIQVT
ncbi:MAG: hypothetical protein ACRDRZ_15630 [Pseudonocardiaceae bacterium]